MTQEDKNMLLKDLCARLPYGVQMTDGVDTYRLTSPFLFRYIEMELKPYLRPMSSMTEEEKVEEKKLWDIVTRTRNDLHYLYTDFLVSNHFDFRGLIPMGLALEAPDGMYKNE